MATKKTSYIKMDLDWLEEQAMELKIYCDSLKPSRMTDRIINGKVIAKIEDQIECKRKTLQDCIKIFEAIDRLREERDAKKTMVRGDQKLSPLETGSI